MASSRDELPDPLGIELQRLLSSSSPSTSRTSPASLRSSKRNLTPEMQYPPILTLDVAGRLFKVSTDILIAESGLFQRQLSARFNWTPQRDGTYFLDADPQLFEHLLRFMRRPSVFPLFWSKNDGFDYDLYQRLETEAEYFQMECLYQWIKDKRYLGAVTIHANKPQTRDLKDIGPYTMSGTTSEDWHYVPRVRKTYICPRGISVHYGNRDGCGRACREYKGDDDTEYDEEDYLEVVSVRKEVVFNESVCKMG